MNTVSIIIICKNAKDIIESAIVSAIDSKPYEIIVVDGKSTDGTRQIIDKYAAKVKVLEDPGKGVAVARQIGVNEAKGEYIYFLGCDNEIEPNSIYRTKEYMLSHDYVYCGMLTRIKDTSNYMAFCNNERWKYKITEGPKSIVGTPFIVKTDILRKFPYNTNLKFADDTDLCERITSAGYKIGYSDVICYETAENSVKELRARYKMYGISDAEFYNQHKQQWTTARKIKSLMHPFKSEFVLGLRAAEGLWTKVKLLPYLTLVTYYRYISWFEHRNILT